MSNHSKGGRWPSGSYSRPVIRPPAAQHSLVGRERYPHARLQEYTHTRGSSCEPTHAQTQAVTRDAVYIAHVTQRMSAHHRGTTGPYICTHAQCTHVSTALAGSRDLPSVNHFVARRRCSLSPDQTAPHRRPCRHVVLVFCAVYPAQVSCCCFQYSTPRYIYRRARHEF